MDRNYHFELTGITPLLMHWDNLDGADALARWLLVPANKKISKAGDDRTPAWTWKHSLYNDGAAVVLPEDCLRACMMKAAAKVPTGKRGGSFKSQSQSGIMMLKPFMDFTTDGRSIPWKLIEKIDGDFASHCAAVRELGFELFAKRATVGQSKHVRVRPRFNKWEVVGELTVIDEQITKEVLKQIFEIAGSYIGLCDWRPSAPRSPGPFGRFASKIKAV